MASDIELESEIEFCVANAEGDIVTSGHDSREEAWGQIEDYAEQHADAGPFTIYEVTRRAVAQVVGCQK